MVFFSFQGKKGRKFIDKKRDVLHTFKVVARSQRDPLAADETAPQGVLQSTNDVRIVGDDGDRVDDRWDIALIGEFKKQLLYMFLFLNSRAPRKVNGRSMAFILTMTMTTCNI